MLKTKLLAISIFLIAVHTAQAKKTDPAVLITLNQAVYSITYQDGKSELVPFKNGKFKKHDKENHLEYQFEIGKNPTLVTKKGTAYVIMWMRMGGTGVFATLKEVDLKSNPPTEIKSFPPIKEDRIKILKISTHAQTVLLNVIKHGPDEPACCPTHKDKIQYPL